MKIHFNTSAVIANNALSNSDNRLSVSTEKLSTGYKINHAKDNPSGIAIARKMNAQIRGLGTASQSASDGISVIETAEGAVAEIQDMLQRMNELAVRGATGTVTSSDRVAIQAEIDQLSDEIERIGKDTEFNGSPLLDGTFDLKGYTNNQKVNVFSYSDSVPLGTHEIDSITAVFDNEGKLTNATQVVAPDLPPFTQSVDGDIITLKGRGTDFEIKLQINGGAPNSTLDIGTSATPAEQAIELDITGVGAMRMQIGANENQELPIRIPRVTLKDLGVEDIDLSTEEGSQKSMEQVKSAITYTSSLRARLGAYQNRLDHTTASLDVTEENMTAAYARIMDTDMAKEMTEYTKDQILVQAGTSMLAQANERPSQVLQLLQ